MTSLPSAASPHHQSFGVFYETEIEPRLTDAEAPRRRAVLWFWVVLLVSAPGLVVWGLDQVERWMAAVEWAGDLPRGLAEFLAVARSVESHFPGSALSEMLAFVLVVGLVVRFAHRRYGRLQRFLDDLIGEKTADYYGLTYEPKPSGGPATRFRQCGLTPGYDRARFESRFSGHHEGIHLSIVEATLKADEGFDPVVFAGPLITLAFPRRFAGRTLVLNEKDLFSDPHASVSVTMEPVRLDVPGFCNRFAIYSSDTQEARSLLSAGFQEKLEALCRLVGGDRLQLAIQGNEALIAVERDRRRAGRDEVSRARAEGVATQVGLVRDIVAALKQSRPS